MQTEINKSLNCPMTFERAYWIVLMGLDGAHPQL